MTEGMRFKDHSVTPILVGLYRVGVVGLHDAIKAAEASGLGEREPLVDRMMAELTGKNYIPDSQTEAFRTALWREYLRHRGQDFSPFFSAVEVLVRGPADPKRERFVELVRSLMAELELQPVFAFDEREGPILELVIRGEVVGRGTHSPRALRQALRHTLSDW